MEVFVMVVIVLMLFLAFALAFVQVVADELLAALAMRTYGINTLPPEVINALTAIVLAVS